MGKVISISFDLLWEKHTLSYWTVHRNDSWFYKCQYGAQSKRLGLGLDSRVSQRLNFSFIDWSDWQSLTWLVHRSWFYFLPFRLSSDHMCRRAAFRQTHAHTLGVLPLCGGAGAELRVVAVQAVLTGGQKVCTGGAGREADVQRGGAELQRQQLTAGTNRAEILSTRQPEALHCPADTQLSFSHTPRGHWISITG